MRALRRLYAELEYLIGVTRLNARTVRLPAWQVRDELAWLEARREQRLRGKRKVT